jgi:hypothetical protein
MNDIRKRPIKSLGYNFIKAEFLPEGKNEYHLRDLKNKSAASYRNLSAYEIEVLVRNNNTSDDWNKIHVSDAFNPELVKNCKFYGLVRIGKLETIALEYHNVCMPVGLYNSTILSCDLGDNVVISNVNYMSHYIIGNEVMICNVHELHVTDHAKFGNGIIKDGEQEGIRVWVEVCNENAGRKILPFNGMLPGDAYLWSRFRDDEVFMQKLKEFTEKKFDNQRGYYGEIGDRCVIKNTSIIKDVWIGSDAYIKGANKLKNLTINSEPGEQTQIGEGCELVNGIIEPGCRIFYGAKAVRFVMASNSQLKYGARLINSYLGNNSTISCCEVLNSLIFPSHEQHHNNSFLCAALVMGQSNIAAGATLGSNHNSRSADGEMVTARGFWPGLCVSIKHNSKFASFTLLAKGDYQHELNIPIPFSLVSNDEANNRLVVMPAYWFMYNLYALARNASKYKDRDLRKEKVQNIEYDFLAPDSVNEIFDALDMIKKFTAVTVEPGLKGSTEKELLAKGEAILSDENFSLKEFEIRAEGFENNSRPVIICKVREAYSIYKKLIRFYGTLQLLAPAANGETFDSIISNLPNDPAREAWTNIGGQLMPVIAMEQLISGIKEERINGWNEVHDTYRSFSKAYDQQKMHHGFASLLEIEGIDKASFTREKMMTLLDETLATKKWMVENIFLSRQKDYQNPFRKMIYGNEEEMDTVLGSLEDNVFISEQEKELKEFISSIEKIKASI